MFRDIGDKFGLIQAQIGVAKCLAQCKRFRDSMNSYQLAVTSCHETDNKVRIGHLDFMSLTNFSCQRPDVTDIFTVMNHS